jgi:5-methylcytosine-specific restriction endonuclease McrA
MKKQFCKKGHDTHVCGRTWNHVCVLCNVEFQKLYRIRHMAEIKKYLEQNREKKQKRDRQYSLDHKKQKDINRKRWANIHPDLVALNRLMNQAQRGLRVVSWGRAEIENIYKNCPINMTIDHIIPLQGKLVSGLHVSWNLRYLESSKNSAKGNRINLIKASELYGMILEKAGLKERKR